MMGWSTNAMMVLFRVVWKHPVVKCFISYIIVIHN